MGGDDRGVTGARDRLEGERLDPESDHPAAHPNARFTTPAAQCPASRRSGEDPAGVPIDAFLFGGRRATVVPLVTEAFDWEHGVFLGATMSVEKTAAADGKVGELRFDPMAMLPFCGYNMADYFGHWLKIAEREGGNLPKVFLVNWFRKDDDGNFVWPGFGDNIRLLEWIFRRCDGESAAEETPIGRVPATGEINIEGTSLSAEDMRLLLEVDPEAVKAQLPQGGASGALRRPAAEPDPGQLDAQGAPRRIARADQRSNGC